jgi:hypothetical protein
MLGPTAKPPLGSSSGKENVKSLFYTTTRNITGTLRAEVTTRKRFTDSTEARKYNNNNNNRRKGTNLGDLFTSAITKKSVPVPTVAAMLVFRNELQYCERNIQYCKAVVAR